MDDTLGHIETSSGKLIAARQIGQNRSCIEEWAAKCVDLEERLQRVEENLRNHEKQIGMMEELLEAWLGEVANRGHSYYVGWADVFIEKRDKFMEGRGD